MARYSDAYRAFTSRLGEVHLLRTKAEQQERHDPIGNADEINALCRGSIVLLCSHVEAYIKELGELTLDRFYKNGITRDSLSERLFYHISKDVVDEIKDTSGSDAIAKKLFVFVNNDSEFWSKNGPFPKQIPSERFNKGFSNPAFKKVRGYLARFGYDKFKNDLDVKLGAKAQPTINMLNHLVTTRNNIAHGDPTATKTPQDLKDMINVVVLFCRTTDQVFGDWCRDQYCAIR